MPWTGQDLAKFESEWSMKPVSISGVMDHEREIKVEKWKDGERGIDLCTPFYTHLNKDGNPCGIMVNRGWLPYDLKDFRYDRAAETSNLKGVLYRGDADTKYSKPN